MALALWLFGAAAGCTREKKTTFAVIPKGRAHLFWRSVNAGAAKAAQENGVELMWNGPTSETDYAAEIQIVEAMITGTSMPSCWRPSTRR